MSLHTIITHRYYVIVIMTNNVELINNNELNQKLTASVWLIISKIFETVSDKNNGSEPNSSIPPICE